jgi:hypothetical protein
MMLAIVTSAPSRGDRIAAAAVPAILFLKHMIERDFNLAPVCSGIAAEQEMQIVHVHVRVHVG